jgi:uncharacterized protein involved in exopolysaccharide biosynthesis
MGVIEALLAFVGLATLATLALGALRQEKQPIEQPVDDVAAPYREGLHAAVRLQRVAQDLEQQIYAEAARHDGNSDADGSDGP